MMDMSTLNKAEQRKYNQKGIAFLKDRLERASRDIQEMKRPQEFLEVMKAIHRETGGRGLYSQTNQVRKPRMTIIGRTNVETRKDVKRGNVSLTLKEGTRPRS